MEKKYAIAVVFGVFTLALFGFVLPALMSHKSYELPLVGFAVVAAYPVAAWWFIKQLKGKTQ